MSDLFSYDYDPSKPIYPDVPGFVRGSDTSEAAARSITPKARSDLHDRICRLVAAFYHGLTSEEIQVALDLTHQNCSARTTELVKMGLLVDCGERRPTSTGRNARVLKVARS
jgi:hypothetical protein